MSKAGMLSEVWTGCKNFLPEITMSKESDLSYTNLGGVEMTNRFFYCVKNFCMRAKGTFFAVFGVGYLLAFLYSYLQSSIPDQICIGTAQTGILNFSVPFEAVLSTESQEVVLTDVSNIPSDRLELTLDQPFAIYAEKEGAYELQLNLFGLFHYKDIRLQVLEETEVLPCGNTVGIYLESDGILVVGTSAIPDAQGELQNPCKEQLRSGDYIVAIDGQAVSKKEDLIQAVETGGGAVLHLKLRRNNKEVETDVTPVAVGNGLYRLGVWVRDDTQGIGTLTYLTKEGKFGALGHGIGDLDTGEMIEIKGGALYEARILDIMRGTIGHPGSLSGSICYGKERYLGNICSNAQTGVFGEMEAVQLFWDREKVMPVAYRQEVHSGKASILSSIDGTVTEYEVEITHVNPSLYAQNKDMVIHVTDERLLQLTGGIVQGMSGSPILQDGKVVGAVTHVFVNDPSRGYGIFLEHMLICEK